MPAVKGTVSSNGIRRRVEALHRAAGELGDTFLQYLLGMALLYLDELADTSLGARAEAPASDDPQIAEAAKLIASGRTGQC